MVRNINESSLPQGWRYDYLDKFAKRGSGHTPNKDTHEYWNGGIKWISLADSSKLDNGFIYETDKEISEAGIKNSSAVLHPEKTVVLSRDAGVGKSAVMFEPMAVSQHFIAWRCDNKVKLNSWFLYNWLQMMKPEFERQAVGSTIKTIGLPYFKKLKIAVPPIDEQTKIAQILSTWDNAIRKLETLIAAKKKRKKALMHQLLYGKQRFSGFEGQWNTKRLDMVIKDFIVPMRDKPENLNGPIPWCRIEDFNGTYLSSSKSNQGVTEKTIKEMNLKVYPVGTLLVSCSADLGRCAIVINPLVTNQTFIGLVPDSNKISVLFLYYLISNFAHRLNTLSSGTTISYLSRKEFEKFSIKIPEIAEQQKIASILSAADKEIETHQKQLTVLKEQKKGLVQQLLTGKKRVQVEVEEVG